MNIIAYMSRITIGCALTLSCLAFAKEEGSSQLQAETLKSHSTVIINRLIERGYRSLKGLDLLNLKQQMAQINWKSEVPNPEARPKFMGHRTSAYYRKDEQSVTVFMENEELHTGTLDLLALHEGLGALGYKDENGQTSMILYLLSEERDLSVLEKSMLERALSFVGGSGTSVGGGGDLTALTIKLKTFQHLKKSGYKMSSLVQYLHSRFEPGVDQEIQDTRLTVSSNRVLEITVPTGAWKKGTPEERNRIISQAFLASNFLLGFNPEYQAFGQLKCDGMRFSQTIYFNPASRQEFDRELPKLLRAKNCHLDTHPRTQNEVINDLSANIKDCRSSDDCI